MAALQRRKNADGSRSTTAIVRMRGFRPTSKTFKADTAKEADALATAWAGEVEASLRSMRQAGSAQRDITRITIRDLCLKFLDDPDIKLLKSSDDYGRQLAWWSSQYGTSKAA